MAALFWCQLKFKTFRNGYIAYAVINTHERVDRLDALQHRGTHEGVQKLCECKNCNGVMRTTVSF